VKGAAGRIFPTTSTPGATEAGAVFYIDRMLKHPFPALLPTYRKGCAALDRHARRRFKRPFPALSSQEQDSVLVDFQQGRVPGFPMAADFFTLLRRHTMEGVLGEPAYGGNRGLAGWRLVGFPGQQFGYSDPYIDRPVDLEPVALDGPFSQEEALHGRHG
jgi:gluconate 2-dehydrogenase gamma chain